MGTSLGFVGTLGPALAADWSPSSSFRPKEAQEPEVLLLCARWKAVHGWYESMGHLGPHIRYVVVRDLENICWTKVLTRALFDRHMIVDTDG